MKPIVTILMLLFAAASFAQTRNDYPLTAHVLSSELGNVGTRAEVQIGERIYILQGINRVLHAKTLMVKTGDTYPAPQAEAPIEWH